MERSLRRSPKVAGSPKLQAKATIPRTQRNEESWWKFYNLLLVFKNEHGHCRVPQKELVYKGLGLWVARVSAYQRQLWWRSQGFFRQETLKCLLFVSTKQRREKKRFDKCETSSMTDLRIKHLDDVGFEWVVCWKGRDSWIHRYSQLVAFKKKHGHCKVHTRPGEGTPWCRYETLGRWVSYQRELYGKGKLATDEVEKLDSIGFCWRGY